MKVRLLIQLLVVCMLMDEAWSSCTNVSLITQEPLELGTIRPIYDGGGFIELDPLSGLSISRHNAAHDEIFGEGRVTVIGMVGTAVTLGIEVIAEDERAHPSIELSELIFRHGVEQTRLGAGGGEFQVIMPNRGTPEGVAKTSIEIGAVMHYKTPRVSQAASYRVRLSCLNTARTL